MFYVWIIPECNVNHYTFNYAFKLERFKQESPQTRKLIHMVALINGLCETFECTIISTVWKTYMYCLSSDCVKHLLVLSSNCGTLTCTIIWLCETLTCTIIWLCETLTCSIIRLCETLTCTFHPIVWNTYLYFSSDCVKHLLVLLIWLCETLTCTFHPTVWNTYFYFSSDCVKHLLVLSSDCLKHYLVLSSDCVKHLYYHLDCVKHLLVLIISTEVLLVVCGRQKCRLCYSNDPHTQLIWL